MDMWYMHGLYWTLLLGQVYHDRCCQCLLVLSGEPMLQWCWLRALPGEELLKVVTSKILLMCCLSYTYVVHARTTFRVMNTGRLNSGLCVETTSTCYGDHIYTTQCTVHRHLVE